MTVAQAHSLDGTPLTGPHEFEPMRWKPWNCIRCFLARNWHPFPYWTDSRAEGDRRNFRHVHTNVHRLPGKGIRR